MISAARIAGQDPAAAAAAGLPAEPAAGAVLAGTATALAAAAEPGGLARRRAAASAAAVEQRRRRSHEADPRQDLRVGGSAAGRPGQGRALLALAQRPDDALRGRRHRRLLPARPPPPPPPSPSPRGQRQSAAGRAAAPRRAGRERARQRARRRLSISPLRAPPTDVRRRWLLEPFLLLCFFFFVELFARRFCDFYCPPPALRDRTNLLGGISACTRTNAHLLAKSVLIVIWFMEMRSIREKRSFFPGGVFNAGIAA